MFASVDVYLRPHSIVSSLHHPSYLWPAASLPWPCLVSLASRHWDQAAYGLFIDGSEGVSLVGNLLFMWLETLK